MRIKRKWERTSIFSFPFFENLLHKCRLLGLLQSGRLGVTQKPFSDSVDQDQTAQNVQSDLVSTLSNKEMSLSR